MGPFLNLLNDPGIAQQAESYQEEQSAKKEEDWLTSLLRGELSKQPEQEKPGTLASRALANFWRGVQQGPNFKSVQQEELEKQELNNRHKQAMISAAVSSVRAKQAERMAMMTDQRARDLAEQNNVLKAAEIQRKIAADADLAMSRKVRAEMGQRWYDLSLRKHTDKQALDEQELLLRKAESEGKVETLISSLAEQRAAAEGRQPTAEDSFSAMQEVLERREAIKAKHKPAATSRMTVAGGELTGQQMTYLQKQMGIVNADADMKFYRTLSHQYNNIRENALNGSGPGDSALLRSFAIMLDPQTGVREEEFRTLAKQAGIWNTWEMYTSGKWVEGEQLSPRARQKFLEVADKVMARANARLTPAIKKHVLALQAAGINNPYERLGLPAPTHDIEEASPSPVKPSTSGMPTTPKESPKTTPTAGKKIPMWNRTTRSWE